LILPPDLLSREIALLREVILSASRFWRSNAVVNVEMEVESEKTEVDRVDRVDVEIGVSFVRLEFVLERVVVDVGLGGGGAGDGSRSSATLI
jgi:hypothetical protein